MQLGTTCNEWKMQRNVLVLNETFDSFGPTIMVQGLCSQSNGLYIYLHGPWVEEGAKSKALRSEFYHFECPIKYKEN